VLDAMADNDFDAAIVDLHMPGMSGLDMLKELRVLQAGGAPRTPVLVLSADVTPDAIQRCMQAGAHTFLAKPVVAVRLLDTLAEIASNRDLKPSAPIVRTLTAGTDGVLDSAVLDELASLGMGEGFEREFIRQCLADAETCMRKAQQDGDAMNWVQFREQSHAIKGVASNLGLVRAANRAGELMRMADWQLKAEWRQRLSVLADTVKEGRLALNARAVHRSQPGVDEADPR
jgi:two-component system sensor histidine kinase RpfC